MKTYRAFTILEAFLLVTLSILIYMWTKQTNDPTHELERYKSSAHTAYALLNKASPKATDIGSFEGKFESERKVVKYFANTLTMYKYCSDARNNGCWSDTWLWKDNEKSGVQLLSFQYIIVDFVSKDCSYNNNIPNTCAFVYVDTNGEKKPNEVGKDILLFYMTKQGFIPAGSPLDNVTKSSDCNIQTNRYSWGCTAQLLGLK